MHRQQQRLYLKIKFFVVANPVCKVVWINGKASGVSCSYRSACRSEFQPRNRLPTRENVSRVYRIRLPVSPKNTIWRWLPREAGK